MKHKTKAVSKKMSRLAAILLVALAIFLPRALLAEETLKLATDERGKFLWVMGTKIAKALNDSGIPTEVLVTGGEDENLKLLSSSNVDIALVTAPALNDYLKDKGGNNGLLTITALWPRMAHFALLDKFIKTGTLADFHRRRVYLGPEGSQERRIAEEIFRSMDIKTKRLVMNVDETNIIDIMTDYIVQRLDGAVFIDYVPSSTVASILGKTGHYYKLIPAEKEPAGLEKGYFKAVVQEELYPYQHEDYITIGVGSYLISRGELSEDTAHKIVEAIFNSVEDIEKDFSYGFGLKRENGAMNFVLPIHPGAEEYFRAVP
ncbi:MAG: TAXI family TRAP transporter solute-binding subunit [Deltaproteobacteria bacterium]|uniref:TAXI family TRAP transporter solute-binding subunit n=1 Tax=Candidatus Zymogenus saltonus TaxID=2844893 RepID=A0A9D8KE61_9DELT|nr:TAXI family TRAP transporter solute-binding subunit [Candidatus Zymogenus saltonus]